MIVLTTILGSIWSNTVALHVILDALHDDLEISNFLNVRILRVCVYVKDDTYPDLYNIMLV